MLKLSALGIGSALGLLSHELLRITVGVFITMAIATKVVYFSFCDVRRTALRQFASLKMSGWIAGILHNFKCC
jgi:hypothetical protein